MGEFIVFLIALLLVIGCIYFLILGYKKRKEKGVKKSLFSLKFVKGIPDLTEGQGVTLFLYDDKVTINDNQSIPIERIKRAVVFTDKELKLKDKSVVGRAAVGALLLGPLGAVLGGMSGVGDKKKEQTLVFIAIQFTNKQGEDNQVVFVTTDMSYGVHGFAKEINNKVGASSAEVQGEYEI